MSLQRQTHKQWTILLRQLSEKLAVFGRAGKKALDESLQKIAMLSHVLKDIDRVFRRAEDARIGQRLNSLQSSFSCNNVNTSNSSSMKNKDCGNNNKEVLINPLDALCRGIAGEEVAALIEALRIHVPSMSLLDAEISEMSAVFLKAVQWEQRGLQDFMRQSLGIPRSTGLPNESVLPTARSDRSSYVSDSASAISNEQHRLAPSAVRTRQGGLQGKIVRSASSTGRSARTKAEGVR